MIICRFFIIAFVSTDIDYPSPTDTLFVRLKYGMSITPLPSKLTPALFRAVSNLVAVFTSTAPAGFQVDKTSIRDAPVFL
jgi:hypothetical protein